MKYLIRVTTYTYTYGKNWLGRTDYENVTGKFMQSSVEFSVMASSEVNAVTGLRNMFFGGPQGEIDVVSSSP